MWSIMGSNWGLVREEAPRWGVVMILLHACGGHASDRVQGVVQRARAVVHSRDEVAVEVAVVAAHPGFGGTHSRATRSVILWSDEPPLSRTARRQA